MDFRLITDDKNVIKSDGFGMVNMIHNQFFVKDGEAWYRDKTREITVRDLIREVSMTLGIWEDGWKDNGTLDEVLADNLQYGTENKNGVIALIYTAMWGFADIRQWYIDLMREKKKRDWIPCNERMPEERNSIFAKYKGTNKWKTGMFEKCSNHVHVMVKLEDGEMVGTIGHTEDGKWKFRGMLDNYNCKAIAWMNFPSPYSRKEI